MKKILLSLLLLLITVSLYAEAKFNDPRLLRYPEAKQWSKDADTNGESAYNIGVLYHKTIKDDKKAIEWFEKAFKMQDIGAAKSAANNLGYIYEDMEENKKAIKFYKQAYKMDNIGGANNLGYLYEQRLKDYTNAELWYKKAAKKGYLKSYKNLALFNRDRGHKIEGAAWYLTLIGIKYPKQKVLAYLKTKWNLTDEEIKKAYQLQKTLDIPKHYYDPELEDTPSKKKIGRK